jgi:hypothetical protein
MANEWNEIGERLQGLSQKLKSHFEQSGPNEWPDALNKLGAAVEDLFKTAGNAVQDEAVRSDVRDVGHLLAGAVSTTLGTTSEKIREWSGGSSDKPDAEAASGAPSSEPSSAASDEPSSAASSEPDSGSAPRPE